MKKMICCLLAGVLLQSAITRAHPGFRPFTFEQKGIRFSIDPRIELYNLMNMLGGITTITPHLAAYKQAIFQQFLSYKEHEGLRFFIRCRMKGWGVDGPTFFMMHLDEKLNLLPGLDESIARKVGGMDTVRQLAKAVQQFATDSHFANFFNNQAVFYNLVLEQTRYAFRDFDERKRLERYYGETNAAYHFILNLLEGGGNFGLPVTTGKGKELFALISTGRVAGELPVFTPDFITHNLIYHEFSHSFVNALVNANAATVAKSQHLLEPIKASMAAQGYNNWLTVVQEHIVRAVTVQLATEKFGETIGRQYFYRAELGRRCIYVDMLTKKLAQYEQQRKKYPRFRDFLPELLAGFQEINPAEIDRLQALVQQFRSPDVEHIPYTRNAKFDSTMVFIIASHEKNEQGMASLKGYVHQLRDMINKKIRIITDDEALHEDMSQCDLMVFGTPAGNSFLQKHIDVLPLKITDSTVLAGELLKGNHFQVVSTWVNPFNPKRTMILHTAQQVEDIRNYFYSDQKDAHHYWVAMNLITIKSGDYKRYFSAWMAE